jgi:soluble lytic murein transglycosylase-like protein
MLCDDTTTARPIWRERNRLGVASCVMAGVLVSLFLARPQTPPPPAASPPVRARALATATVATLFDALSKCRASLPESERWRIAGAIHHESRKYGYDPLFVAAMVEVESKCKPTARGIHGAVGLIQIRPATAKAVAAESGVPWKGDATLRDGVLNVRLGVRYLWTLEKKFDDAQLAIAAYNLGPTRVARMNRQRARNAKYVQRVLGRYQDLVELYS